MSVHNAGMMQQPPDEEASELVRPKKAQDSTSKMARRLLAAYYREADLRKFRVGSVVVTHAREPELTTFWYKLARKMILLEIKEPERYMHAQFKHSAPIGDTLLEGPLQNMLLSDDAIKRYETYADRAEGMLSQALESNKLQFKLSMVQAHRRHPDYGDEKLWNFVLGNKIGKMSPLFRYCLAISENMSGPAEDLKPAAIEQLLTDPPGYLRSWGDVIPRPLIDELEETLAQI